MMAVTTSTSAGRSDRAAPALVRPQLEQHFDVWSRSGSKYRVRAIVLLAVNVLLFAGVGCFAYWIRTGFFFAPALKSYSDEISAAFNYGQNTSRSLADFLVGAINVQDVPMQIPIVGLLLATLIAIPILIYLIVNEKNAPDHDAWVFIGIATALYTLVSMSMTRFSEANSFFRASTITNFLSSAHSSRVSGVAWYWGIVSTSASSDLPVEAT